jgi:small subunit ribosomal protein S4
VNIASIRVKIGDEITIKTTSKQIPIVQEALKQLALDRPEWSIYNEWLSFMPTAFNSLFQSS